MIGINVSGAEYTWETYPGTADLDYLQSKGVELIRLPFGWEKMQPVLGGPLDAEELQAMKTCLAEAAERGIQVIIDLHNYGRYDSQWAAKAAADYGFFAPGSGDTIGSAAVPISTYADFWSKMATALEGQPGLAGYDIMNEPYNMGGATVWPSAAQAAVNAIRAIDMNPLILVEGTQWASAQYWPSDNANLHIIDPADKLLYEAHIYFDQDGSGKYAKSYDAQGAYANIGVDRIQPFLDWLEANNAKGFIGEFGVPDTDPRWLTVLENVTTAMDEAGISGTYWNYTYQSPTGVDWWPVDDPQSIKPLYDGTGLGQLGVLQQHLDTYEDPSFSDGGGPPPVTVPAPAIVSFSNDSGVAGDSITNDSTITLAGTAAANSTVRVYDGATLLGSATATGAGVWSFTTAALVAGGHSLTARASNSAGDTSAPSAALNLTIDTTAPSIPTIASFSNDSGVAGDGITNDATLTLAGAAPAGSTVSVYDGATLIGATIANGSGSWSYTTSPLANGGHALTARATDAAGNMSAASAVRNVTIDTAAPSPPAIVSFSNDSGVLGDGITSDSTVTLSGTASANVTVSIYDGATLLGTAVANASGAWGYTTGALSNGGHSLTARVSDAAGNVGTSAALNVTIDTAAPPAPTIASFSNDSGVVGDGITNDSTLTLAGAATANATVRIYDGATLLGTTVANGSGNWSFTTASLANGGHGLTATASDAAGNTSAASAVRNVTIDTAAPAVPTIASFSSDTGVVGDGITTDNTLTLSGIAAANTTVGIYDGTTLLGTSVANAAGNWSYTTAPLGNGNHGLTARASDAAGNTSAPSTALNLRIDPASVAPTIAAFSTDSGAVGDGITNDSTLTLNGAAAANSAVSIYDGATLLGTTLANAGGAWSYTTAPLSNGAHGLTARVGPAGSVATSAALNLTIDTSAPSAPTIASFSNDSGALGDGITNDNTLTLSGAAAANSTVKIYDGATQIGSAVAGGSGTWSFTTTPLSNGGHSLTARASDAAGNTSPASAALNLTIASLAPTQTLIEVRVSGDQYQGNAEFRLLVDGQQVGDVHDVTAIHRQGQWETIAFAVDTPPDGLSEVSVEFLNDAWGGNSAADRNLFVDSVRVNGVSLLPQEAIYDRGNMPDIAGQSTMAWGGALKFDVSDRPDLFSDYYIV